VRARDPEEEVPLLDIDAYRAFVLEHVERLAPETTMLEDAWGSVLAEDAVAPRALPPFASSAMDGYAVRSVDIESASEDAPVALRVLGEVRMGAPTALAVGRGQAVTVPTGGVIPSGADVVVPVELCARDGDDVQVLRALPANKHLRPAGEDVTAGQVLVPADRRLFAPDLGALAAAGLSSVRVHPRAVVGIVSTGDELVEPGHVMDDAKIFDSNTYTLIGAVNEADAVPLKLGPVSDDPDELIRVLDMWIDDVDVFVCSGGVSMGERDPVKRAFETDGEVSFFNVAMQPGRPQAFGRWRRKPLFGLPGNPISVFVSFEMFVRPALMRLMGRTDERPWIDATLDDELEAANTRTRYARVRVRREDDGFVATPEGGHQSNLLATFARSDGLAEIPAGTRVATGERCRVLVFRDLA
jgi:molybdopterin molybdotransferase